MRGDTGLGLVPTSKEERDGDVKFRDSFGCSVQELLKFRIMRGGEKIKNQDYNPGVLESRLWPAWVPVGTNPIENVLGENRGSEELIYFSRTTFSVLKNDPSSQGGSQAKVVGVLHG